MNEQTSLLLQLVLIFGTASVIVTLFHYLKLPSIIGYIGSGVAIGPFGFNFISSLPQVHLISKLAIIFLMFTIGLEFSFTRLKELKNVFLKVGFFQVFITSILITLCFHFFYGLSWGKAFTISLIVSLSSTALIFRLLQEKREMSTPHGKISTGILLFQDIAIIPLMMILPFIAKGTTLTELISMSFLLFLGKIIAVFLFLWFCGRYLIPIIFDKVISTRNRELFFFSIIFLCLSIAYLLHTIELSYSLGAFIAGFLISESSYGKQALVEVKLLRDNFLGIFFISIGFLLNMDYIYDKFLNIFSLGILIFSLKASVIYVILRFNSTPHKISLLTSLILFQMGEFSFLIADESLALGLIREKDHQFFLSLTVLSLVLTPFIFKFAPQIAHYEDFSHLSFFNLKELRKTAQSTIRFLSNEKPNQKTLSEKTEKKKDAIIIGYGHAGQNLAKAFNTLGIPYSIIDLNYSSFKKYSKKGEPFVFGDATQVDILKAAGINRARLVVIAVNGIDMTKGILKAIKNIRPDVHVIARTQYLLDIAKLDIKKSDDLVVAEFETTLEILARSLKLYGVPSRKTHSFISDCREQLSQNNLVSSDSLRSYIELPKWDALSSIQPIVIEEDSFSAQKTLTEIDLRKKTSAAIIAVYREGLGTHLPDAQFQLLVGDVAYTIGSKESLQNAENLLHMGIC